MVLMLFLFTLVIGPDILGRCPDCPETELLGLVSVALEGLALKAVILCETPEAKVNCSRNSTFVRPLAVKRLGKHISLTKKIIVIQKNRELFPPFQQFSFVAKNMVKTPKKLDGQN